MTRSRGPPRLRGPGRPVPEAKPCQDPPMDVDLRLNQTRRALLVVTVLWLGTIAAHFVRWRGGMASATEDSGSNPLDDPALREAAIAKLVEAGANLWDTFPDPEVGRVLQPYMNRKDIGNVAVVTNDL